MRSAVFLGRSCKIGPPGQRCGTLPDQSSGALDSRREDLIFKVSVEQARLLDELEHSAGFCDVAGKGLFAGNSDELCFSRLDRIADGFHVLDALVVWAAKPDGIDFGSLHHVLN